MTFLSPLAAIIAAGIAVPALVALYFLKLRRTRREVPSTLLWHKAVHDLQVNAPFQRLRRSLLLLLQLLLLACLLIAMARPTTQAIAVPGQRSVIVIDHSASMNIAEPSLNGRTRLEEARRLARELVDQVAASAADGDDAAALGGAMIVSVSDRAVVEQNFTTDAGLLRQAIDRIGASDGLSRIDQAVSLLEPLGRQGGDEPMLVYVISDGGASSAAGELALSGAEVRERRVVDPGPGPDNVAIVSFSARRDLERPQVVEVFARLHNHGDAAVEAQVTLKMDGRTLRVQPVQLPPRSVRDADATSGGSGGPGERVVRMRSVLPGSGLLTVEHDVEDALPADNSAAMHVAPSRRLRVLLVTTGNPFLERVLEASGVQRLVQMPPARYADQDPARLARGGWDAAGLGLGGGGVDEGFDVVVFDGYSPQQTPPVDSIYIGSAPPIEGLTLVEAPAEGSGGGGGSGGFFLDWDRNHPVMRNVRGLDRVELAGAGRLIVPDEAQVLAVGLGGPTIALVMREQVRHLVVGFDVLESSWPLSVSFFVFFNDGLEFLGLGGLAEEAGLMYRPGQVVGVELEDTSAATVRYRGPSSTSVEATVREGRAALGPMPRAGVYRAVEEGAVSSPGDVLAVNLLDAAESDPRVLNRALVLSASVQGAGEAVAIRREVWHWFAWAALGLLLVEWVVYSRRMHL